MAARINSKQKGASFERKSCVRLSHWVSRHTRDDVFWRSAMSGGRATLGSRRGRGQKMSAHAGDISAIAECGHFFLSLFQVECKFYKDLKLETIIWGNIGFIKEIWAPTFRQCKTMDPIKPREPFIMARQNRKDELIITTTRGLQLMRDSLKPDKELKCHCIFPLYDMHVVHLRDFLLFCCPIKMRSFTESSNSPRRRKVSEVSPRRRRKVSEVSDKAQRIVRRFVRNTVPSIRRRRVRDV